MLKISKSKLREIIREVIREADESDKYSHIGYGKYREKGKEDDKDAQTFQKTDSGKFEPVGGEKSGEKEKPKPKVTKIAADPFADKDSETGKDYTKKFTGTDEPEDDDSETAYQSGAKPTHKIATDVYYINKYEGGGDDFEQEAVPAYKISNIEDMLAADSGNQLYISKGEEGYFDGKSFTSEKGSTTTLEPDHVKGTDKPKRPQSRHDDEIINTIKSIAGDDVKSAGTDEKTGHKLFKVGDEESDQEYTVDQKGNIWVYGAGRTNMDWYEPEIIDGPDDPDKDRHAAKPDKPQPSGEETEIEKVLNTVWGKGGFEGTEDDTFEAVELLRDKGIPDDEIRNWLDDEFDASEEDLEYWMTGDEDVYDDDDEDEWEESIIPQLKKEFKQYGFAQKSKNWKRVMI